MKMVDIIECLREMTYSPTKSNPIFPPSHSAHARPKHVKRCIRGPSVAPLNDRAWRTKGIWFVTSPRARKGAKSLGSLTDFCSDAAESTRIRFRGGGLDLISSVDEVVTAAIFAGGLCAEPIFAVRARRKTSLKLQLSRARRMLALVVQKLSILTRTNTLVAFSQSHLLTLNIILPTLHHFRKI